MLELDQQSYKDCNPIVRKSAPEDGHEQQRSIAYVKASRAVDEVEAVTVPQGLSPTSFALVHRLVIITDLTIWKASCGGQTMS